MIKWKFIVIIIVCGGIFLSYMGYFDKPEDCIDDFFDAYNQQDVRKMLEIIDNPEVSKIKSVLSFTGVISDALVGVDMGELLLDFMPISEDLLGYTGSRMHADIQSSEMDFLRNRATVHVRVMTESDDKSSVDNLLFKLKKKDRKWYITDVQEDY
ncbi:hypothetical protein [Lysinibacillus sp. NPDC056185]|uniref:hypothetical protein n=1 Tax=Lysinibacillus sp. NPDC056185 TaxID=3345739 RepID=UPI0039F01DFD